MNKLVMAPELGGDFSKASRYRSKRPKTKPIPIRFTEAELAYLRDRAGKLPLSTYIRQEALGGKVDTSHRQRQPKVNQKELTAILGALGQSRLASNMNQLSRSANIGVLDVSPEVEQQLKDAYLAILAMREALFMALGLRSK